MLHLPNPNFDPRRQEHIEGVYAAFREFEPNELVLDALQRIVSIGIQPSLTSAPGVLERVGSWRANRLPLMFVAPHQLYPDHLADLALTRQTKELETIAADGHPLSKVCYFALDKDAKIKDRAVSALYKLLRGWPAEREEDLEFLFEQYANIEEEARYRDSDERPLDASRALVASGRETTRTAIHWLQNGEVVHGYPTRTRNTEDWSVTGPVFGIFSKMLVKMSREGLALAEQQGIDTEEAKKQGLIPALLVAGRSYGTTEPKPWHEVAWSAPHYHIETFIEGPFTNQLETTELIADSLQLNLTAAHANHLGDNRRTAAQRIIDSYCQQRQLRM